MTMNQLTTAGPFPSNVTRLPERQVRHSLSVCSAVVQAIGIFGPSNDTSIAIGFGDDGLADLQVHDLDSVTIW